MSETNHLASYAARDTESRGRVHPETNHDFRAAFQHDRDRIVHSTAFRRLVYKTQVFVNHEGDLYRTRLTHTLEVAQIARTIAHALNLNESLTEAICLAHDLGHTAFGHAGQDALNECMQGHGGFEHNMQSLRVVDELEERYAEFPGLNLSFETREGILKHCSLNNARNLGPLGERFINRHQPSLEAQVANLADEIAYNNHDVDDGLRAGLITIEELCSVQLFRREHESVLKEYPSLSGRRLISEINRRMISHVVTDLIEASARRIKAAELKTIDDVRRRSHALIGLSDTLAEDHLELKQFLKVHVYRHFRVLRMTTKAHKVIQSLFVAFFATPELMPPDYQRVAEVNRDEQGDHGLARAVADYIAGMTDRYAILEYERMFNPAERS